MAAPGFRCELLPWDSAHFGFAVGRLHAESLSPAAAAAALDWAQSEGIRCLYYLAASDDQPGIDAASAAGFRLADLRFTFEWAAAEAPAPPLLPPGYRLRSALRADAPALRALAASSHRNTRFAVDPGFSLDRSDELYAIWIEKSIEPAGGGQVLIAESPQGGLAGYISCDHGADGRGQIGLIAVAESDQGRGLGLALVQASQAYFAAQGLGPVIVVTQGRNLAAQRLYERAAFLMRDVSLWFHRWFD